ncbi:translational GTPase TypA [Cloacibacillus porcorum]|uniref:Large ribosomal subunit assembly factor BipA n=1 Tax=Cloacibacillus porcorum TaxID=1197717 RepID=A0A1B2I3A9_9BACT|nr:translational GTPase TypA [Cloacibacillus porcorum]ANZ44432.1 GTP-binding protein TypA [Cloacibacillus porcorum]MCC8185191.1 translational GTPase TypA [Cloacibacillus porcorum]MCI5864483.1 translational GTPase TypA [Cloacibacillus porcorum]MDD7649347.1 translational GTPase TypA [Cloacibacillus porcorum]MDY4093995.1 translational GTPase TypA [Cloacibacillus porcorum]
MQDSSKIRNIAIIAHIDHGKTTLIDGIFKAAHLFRENQVMEERVMDAGNLERERGITIKAKHCTVEWEGYKINIVDTPGHADFSGEVERVLSMVDSVLLLVDANEGPMPQTRYVLMRALKLGLKPIVIVNKVDRPNAEPDAALDKTFDLFIELGATEEQCDFAVLYGSGLQGWFVDDLNKHEDNSKAGMQDLFKTIIERVPAPKAEMDKPFLMQVCTLSWSEYLGRIGCGRILQGTLRKGDRILRTHTRWTDYDQTNWEVVSTDTSTCTHLYVTNGLDRAEVEAVGAGDIVWFTGPANIDLGDTMSAPEIGDQVIPPLDIEEPTVSMFFIVNTSPFAGQDGNAITLRQLKARIERETKTDPALRMEDLGRPDGVKVSGRGELHLGILIEEIRREGSEVCVSRPEVIVQHDEKGRTLEPMEEVIIDVPEEYQGVVIQKLAQRKGELKNMENGGTGVLRLEFRIPTRGLIGYRGEFLTDTRGLGILASRFVGYGEWVGEINARSRGSLVSMDSGTATSYALDNLQERGTLFIKPGDAIYNGQVVGESSRGKDIPCNPSKRKQQTNHRSATKDMMTVLDVPRTITVDSALEWISDDELVEVTPLSVRIRKTILDADQRKKARMQAGISDSDED